MATNEYRNQIKEQSIEKIREMLLDMPEFVSVYMRGISQSRMATTRLGYLIDIRTFFQWLCTDKEELSDNDMTSITTDILENLKSSDFEAYLEFLDKYEKNGTIYTNDIKGKRRKFSAIRSLYEYLYKNDYIQKNPIVKVDVPYSRDLKHHDVIALDAAEAANLLDNVEFAENLSDRQKKHHDNYKLRDLAIITLLLSTGVRVSELVGLNLQDVNYNENKITVVRKGGFVNHISFNEEAKIALLDYVTIERNNLSPAPGDENALFLSNRNSRLTVRSVERLVKKYAENTVPGKHITTHKLRSSCATLMIKEENPINTVRAALGHRSISTTQLYIQEDEEALRKAAKSLKFRD